MTHHEVATETSETLRALLTRMHNAIWGPWVDPIERQNEELEWLKLVFAHAGAMERLEHDLSLARASARMNAETLTAFQEAAREREDDLYRSIARMQSSIARLHNEIARLQGASDVEETPA